MKDVHGVVFRIKNGRKQLPDGDALVNAQLSESAVQQSCVDVAAIAIVVVDDQVGNTTICILNFNGKGNQAGKDFARVNISRYGSPTLQYGVGGQCGVDADAGL